MKLPILLCVARALALAWAGFWLWFGIASGIGERLDTAGVLLHALVPGGLAMLAALTAWRNPVAGGWLLIAESLAVLALMATGGLHPVNVWVTVVLALTLALPPLVSGILFLAAGKTSGTPSPA